MNINFRNWFNNQKENVQTTTTNVDRTSNLPPDFKWETLPVLTDGELMAARSRAIEVIPQRTADPEEAYRQVGQVYKELHQQVIGSSRLGTLKARIEEAMQNGKTLLASLYADACSAAEKVFVDLCLPHTQTADEEKAADLERAKQLRQENENLERQHADYGRRLTGDPDIRVEKVNQVWLLSVSILSGAIVSVTDAFLGAPSFKFGSNSILAYAMSFAIGFSIGAILYFWASASKRIDAFHDAVRALSLYKARHPRDLKVQALQLIEPSRSDYSTRTFMKALFISVLVGTTVARYLTSRDSQTLVVTGMTAMFFIAVVSILGYFIEYKIAPPYGEHHKLLNKMTERIEENDEEIDLILNPDPEEGEPEWMINAKARYEAGMNNAWEKVNDQIAGVYGSLANYRHLVSEIGNFSSGLQEQHVGTCREVTQPVLEAKAAQESLDKVDYTFDRNHAASFLSLPNISDPFTGLVESGAFNPENMRPARIPAEPNRLLQELLANAPKPQEPNKPKRPIINIRTL